MSKTYVIKRRSGHRINELSVVLPKPPEEYQQGETLTIQIEGRNVPVHVEIDCQGEYNNVLYVS
jgi:hypothetical protein